MRDHQLLLDRRDRRGDRQRPSATVACTTAGGSSEVRRQPGQRPTAASPRPATATTSWPSATSTWAGTPRGRTSHGGVEQLRRPDLDGRRREKPEIAAPGTNIRMLSNGFPWGGQTDSGTSFAAPMVAGTAARLIQRKPFLGIWPEQLRAILMSSAANNIEGATRLADVDGAGMMAVNTAARILEDTQHGGQQVDATRSPLAGRVHDHARSRSAASCRDLLDGRPLRPGPRQSAERRPGSRVRVRRIGLLVELGRPERDRGLPRAATGHASA